MKAPSYSDTYSADDCTSGMSFQDHGVSTQNNGLFLSSLQGTTLLATALKLRVRFFDQPLPEHHLTGHNAQF